MPNRVCTSERRSTRDEAVRRSLVAVHTLLAIDDGRFVSSLDPPLAAAAAVGGCQNDGTFPVLIGGGGDVVLSSPIILYDQPEIAPESAGDLYDATEIDEILALRVLTLTDEEKSEARGTDARAAAIVDRCDDLPPEVWARLHGAIRSITPVAEEPPAITPWWDPDADAEVDPWSERTEVAGVELCAGSKVVLRPGHRRADAHDMFLAGMAATVTGVFRDAEGEVHLAVTVDDDPANEELSWQGRYLFFRPDEVEPQLRSPATQAAAGAPRLAPRRSHRTWDAHRETLVAGIGNIFFGDDAFGVEVAGRLAGRELPDGVRLGEYGIRGIHLAYELLEGYDTLVLIDAVPIGQPAGTVAVIEVDMDDVATRATSASMPTRCHRRRCSERWVTSAAASSEFSSSGANQNPSRRGSGSPRAVAAAVEVAVDEVVKVLDVLASVTTCWKGTVMRLVSGLLFTVFAALVLSAIVRSAPDVNRYLKIRNM